MPIDHNPYLNPQPLKAGMAPEQTGAKGEIERPPAIQNFVWQTRSHSPTEYEICLGDAFEAIFSSGVAELAVLVEKLNELGVPTPDGARWTSDNFRAAMTKLAG